MLKNTIKTTLAAIFTISLSTAAYTQNTLGKTQNNGAELNTITTAVPFLLISPDSRAGGMGDAGVASTPDANSIHWNPAKLGFATKELGFAISYTPWLRQLVPDINLSYLSGFKKIDEFQTIGASMRYFTLGDIQFTDEFGNNTVQFRPNEFAFDVAYARKLSDNFSGGIAIRYIYSNLTGGQTVGGGNTKAGQAVAADVSAYYVKDDLDLGDKDGEFAAGINISNIGNKMSYTSTSRRDFIPINLRIGPRFTVNLDEYNSLSFILDANKLLVPTPPIYLTDSSGLPVVDSNGELVIAAGNDPDRPVAAGMFGSFTDAPGTALIDENGFPIVNADGTYEVQSGSVFREELREFNLSGGMEYWYDNQLAIRAGYFHEHSTKGNRKYFTLGAGLRYKVVAIDFSYLIPVYFNNNIVQRSPLQNTLRFTLKFDFDNLKKDEDEPSIN